MDGIEKEAEKLVKRQKILHKNTSDSLDKMIKEMEKYQETLKKDPNAVAPVLQNFTKDITGNVKEYYNAMNRLSKSIEKKFNCNLELAGRSDAFEGKDALVDEAVAMHLIREGHFDLFETFRSESKLNMDPMLKERFREMYYIIEQLRSKDLAPALDWAKRSRAALEIKGSNLEFRLHRLQFIKLLLGQPVIQPDVVDPTEFMDIDPSEQNIEKLLQLDQQGQTQRMANLERSMKALEYAKAEFGYFGEKHLKEIQKLMTAVLYCSPRSFSFLNNKSKLRTSNHPLSDSPYADLLSSTLYIDIEEQFKREFCTLMGTSQDPALQIVVNVGSIAIPTMIKLRSVMDERRKERPKVEMWSVQDELPVEIPLPKSHRYHSVFTCPVSREPTTDMNPPMMLPCGHVISRESLVRLSKGKGSNSTAPAPPVLTTANVNSAGVNSSSVDRSNSMDVDEVRILDVFNGISLTSKLKCPYCPTECTIGQTMRLLVFIGATLCVSFELVAEPFGSVSGKRCLSMYVGKDVLVVAKFKITSSTADFKLGIEIHDTDGNTFLTKDNANGEFKAAFHTHGYSDIVTCFTNVLNPGVSRRQEWFSTIKFDLDVGAETLDTKEIMKQENLKPLEADLVVMESMMEAIIDELEFLKQREARMRDTNESTNDRVKFYSILNMLALVLSGVGQLFYLRQFFKSKKIL